jgi:hypothetical protein
MTSLFLIFKEPEFLEEEGLYDNFDLKEEAPLLGSDDLGSDDDDGIFST